MKYDPNAGQNDDEEAVAVLTGIIGGWDVRDMRIGGVQINAAVADILVELPRRGWHLQRILPEPDLAEAWRHAEAALPPDWQFELGRYNFDGDWYAFAKSRRFWLDHRDADDEHVDSQGPTAAGALQALAAQLAVRTAVTDPDQGGS